MSKIFKKIAAIAMAGVMTGVMTTGMVMSAYDVRPVCPPHYAGNPVITGTLREISAGTHEHLYYVDANGNEYTKTCSVTIVVYIQETKCLICKKVLETSHPTETKHSVS